MRKLFTFLITILLSNEGFFRMPHLLFAPEGDGEVGAGGGAGSGEGNGDGEGNNGDGSGSQGQDGDGSGNQNQDKDKDKNKGKSQEDFDSLPPWAQKQIKDLRAENGNRRTESKSLSERLSKLEGGLKSALGLGDDDKVTPEEQIQNLQASNQEATFENAILSLALNNGISGEDNVDYLGFLVSKEADSLGDDEEISDERMLELIQKVKAKGNGQNNTSSVDGTGNGGATPPPAKKGDVTLEQFNAMNILERTKLRVEKRDVYERLATQARANGTF